ncbi:MAG: hypothetical protein CMO45_05790 [Verrucomicrobiales bacterium]|nr:hypothetical protein [Verrucomicrobiales bacterium]
MFIGCLSERFLISYVIIRKNLMIFCSSTTYTHVYRKRNSKIKEINKIGSLFLRGEPIENDIYIIKANYSSSVS